MECSPLQKDNPDPLELAGEWSKVDWVLVSHATTAGCRATPTIKNMWPRKISVYYPAMIDDNSTATTAELCALLGCTKAHLSHLERDGVISRADRNRWPLVKTVRAVLNQARAQRNALSEARLAWEKARAEREALRVARETHVLVEGAEFDLAWQMTIGPLVAALVEVPPRCTRDVAMRSTIEREINAARHAACDAYERQAESLRATGKAALGSK